jgi:hypothetical protein
VLPVLVISMMLMTTVFAVFMFLLSAHRTPRSQYLIRNANLVEDQVLSRAKPRSSQRRTRQIQNADPSSTI